MVKKKQTKKEKFYKGGQEGNTSPFSYQPFPTRQTWPDLRWLDQYGTPIPETYLQFFIYSGIPPNTTGSGLTLSQYRNQIQIPTLQLRQRVHIPRSNEIRVIPLSSNNNNNNTSISSYSSPAAPSRPVFIPALPSTTHIDPNLHSLQVERKHLQDAIREDQEQLSRHRELIAHDEAVTKEQLRQIELDLQQTQQEEKTIEQLYQQKLKNIELEEKRRKREIQLNQFETTPCSSKPGSAMCLLEIINRHPDLVLCAPLGGSSNNNNNSLPEMCPGFDNDRFRAYILDRNNPNLIVASMDKDGLIERYEIPIPIPAHLYQTAPTNIDTGGGGGGGRRRGVGGKLKEEIFNTPLSPASLNIPLVNTATERDTNSLYRRVEQAPEVSVSQGLRDLSNSASASTPMRNSLFRSTATPSLSTSTSTPFSLTSPVKSVMYVNDKSFPLQSSGSSSSINTNTTASTSGTNPTTSTSRSLFGTESKLSNTTNPILPVSPESETESESELEQEGPEGKNTNVTFPPPTIKSSINSSSTPPPSSKSMFGSIDDLINANFSSPSTSSSLPPLPSSSSTATLFPSATNNFGLSTNNNTTSTTPSRSTLGSDFSLGLGGSGTTNNNSAGSASGIFGGCENKKRSRKKRDNLRTGGIIADKWLYY